MLCPNATYSLGSFEEYDQNGLYIGGSLRMQAAVDLRNDRHFAIRQYIVVGGGLDVDPAHQWKKTENMRRFLMRNGIPKDMITGIVSGADTLGNFRAIWKTYHRLLAGKVVGVLSNGYHLPRAMCIVNDPQFEWDNVRFFALHAERLVSSKKPQPHIQDQAFRDRILLERQGLLDWKNAAYTRQQVPVQEWRGERLPDLLRNRKMITPLSA